MSSLPELAGRMLMVGVRGASMEDERTREDIEACRSAQVGGVVLFDKDLGDGGARNIESPEQLRLFIETLRHELGGGLIVSVDQEGGSVARLSREAGFAQAPGAQELAEMGDRDRRRAFRAVAARLADLEINLNFAPCVDLAADPESAIIASKGRSFGSDPDRVAQLADEWTAQHAMLGVRSCVKHFPGHGSARGDTHAGLVDITETYDEGTELDVFEHMVGKWGASVAVMTGHLMHTTIDANHPASLSRAHTGGLLRARLDFSGVVVTDSLDMGAITVRYSQAEALALAVNAGADILLDGANAPGVIRPGAALAMHRAVIEGVESGAITGGVERLEASSRRLDRLFAGAMPLPAQPADA